MGSQKNTRALIFLVAIASVVAYFSVRSCGENDETRIRKVIYTGVLCVEGEDLRRCLPLVSDRYADEYGHSKLVFLKLVKDIFADFRDIKVEVKQLLVRIKADEAEADVAFTCIFRKLEETQLYYDNGKLKVHFRKEDGRWKVDGVAYEGAGEMLFLQSVA